jgi:Na+-translocating ferredoxin:NAD+ oxidoreductase RNF subunit RnfB
MSNTSRDTEKLRKIVNLLPGENCGKCGYDNCGAFATALADGKASPLDCHNGDSSSVKEICEVLGIEVPEETASVSTRHGLSHHGGHHDHHGGHHGGHHGHEEAGCHHHGHGW